MIIDDGGDGDGDYLSLVQWEEMGVGQWVSKISHLEVVETPVGLK